MLCLADLNPIHARLEMFNHPNLCPSLAGFHAGTKQGLGSRWMDTRRSLDNPISCVTPHHLYLENTLRNCFRSCLLRVALHSWVCICTLGVWGGGLGELVWSVVEVRWWNSYRREVGKKWYHNWFCLCFCLLGAGELKSWMEAWVEVWTIPHLRRIAH